MVDFLNWALLILTYVIFMSLITVVVIAMWKFVTYIFKSRRNY